MGFSEKMLKQVEKGIMTQLDSQLKKERLDNYEAFKQKRRR